MTQASSISSFRTVEHVLPTEAGIAEALSRAVGVFGQAGLGGAHLFFIELSTHEALVNALIHGVRERGATQIRLTYEIDSRRVQVVVEDDGAAVVMQDGRDIREEGYGRGLWLIRAFMSRVSSEGGVISMELDLDDAPVPSYDQIPTMLRSWNSLLW
jgi:anti-sigma regulatory factor (Ser/Thr protein kinase)